MKKVLILLMIVPLLCGGCALTREETPEETIPQPEEIMPPADDLSPLPEDNSTPIEPLLESYLDEEELPTPVRDYGESTSYYVMMDEANQDFVARVLYPIGKVNALNQALEHWVQQTAAYYQAEAAGSRADEDSAELTVDYSSYIVEDSFVGVKLNGIFERPYMAHPIDVSASFNADAVTGKLLTLDDVLLPGGREALQNMVVEQAGIESALVDENLLNHWLLTPDGLEITLVRGDYLPMSDGTVTLLYSYRDLDGIFSLPRHISPEDPAQDVPQPDPPSLPETADSSLTADPSRPMLALTFDDGPSAYTARLLDAFAEYGGRGTFYVVGNMLDARPETLRRMAEEGHEIGGHSWNHRQLTKLSEEDLTDQLMSTRAKIYEITGVDTTTARPPYGSCNEQVKATAGALGISLVNWSVDTLDWKYRDADAVYNAIMDGAKDGAIILCHDLHETTVDAVERAIPALIAEGYQLVTVTDLLTVSGKPLRPGSLYFKR